jgi:ABC-type antimicrobial peptide transport system permease subunit
MEIFAIILSIISLLIAIIQVVFVARSIKSKSYLQYRKQLENFERTKKRIAEELDNERKKFE